MSARGGGWVDRGLVAAVEGGGFGMLPVQPGRPHHKAGWLIEDWWSRLGRLGIRNTGHLPGFFIKKVISRQLLEPHSGVFSPRVLFDWRHRGSSF